MQPSSHNKNGAPNGVSYRFGDFLVDAPNRICTRNGASVAASGKVYDILLAFVENPNRLLTKDALIERVWPDEFVEEGNLARNVSTLRKALGDTDKQHKYILTVPGHGYRFAVEVSVVGAGSVEGKAPIQPSADVAISALVEREDVQPHSRKLFWALATVIVLFSVAWFGKDRFLTPAPSVNSIAVLPLRGIDPNDNYLGIGIADAVIRRLSTSGQVTVRPTSAVLHYVNQDTDTLAAARELNADAILEGNVQRSGNRLRVSVNLLRTADARSIWNDSFEMASADIFRIQDQVAEQVAERLRIRLAKAKSSSASKNPPDQLAYEWYLKGLYSLDQRRFDASDMEHMLDTIDFFKRAIEIDPNYAPAHGQLAFSYAWMAMFVDTNEEKWAPLARQEIARSEELDPTAPEPHVAAGLIYWSAYGNYAMESSIKELRRARQLDPNFSGADLAALYGHVGLEQQAMIELRRVEAIDPTSQALKGLDVILPYLRGDPDGWLAVHPERPLDQRDMAPWYLVQKRSLDMAQKLIHQRLNEPPSDYDATMMEGLIFALKGDFRNADAKSSLGMSKVNRNYESYHHHAYFAACISAVEGNAAEAVKWLRETANTGYPNYPLFARDPSLDHIRQSPEFIQFLAEQKAQYDRFEQEFPDA